MIVLRIGMSGEDIFDRTNGKCHVFTFLHARGRYYWAQYWQVSFV